MFKKDVVLSAGGYPSDWKTMEDYRLFYEIIKMGFKAKNIQEYLVSMRAGNGQLSRRGRTLNRYNHLLRKEMYKDHYISWFSYVFVTAAIDIGHNAPPHLKKAIYRHFLRKSEKNHDCAESR